MTEPFKHSLALTALTICLAAAGSVSAQGPAGMAPAPGEASGAKPGILGRIGIDQRLNTQLPLDLPFVDETGRQVRLGDFFGTRPVILALVYYECPMLCTQVLNGLVTALGVMEFEPGREFEVVAVSFNPKEGPGLASQKKASYLERYDRPHTAAGWHFLTGSQASIARLTEAVGFRYEFDDRIKQFAHGAGIEVLTPRGTISKYFYGIEYSARDIRLGIIEASDERIGTVIDDVLLFCYHYDPATGRYGAAVLRLVRVAGIATVVVFLSFLTVSLRREAASSRREGPAGSAAEPRRRARGERPGSASPEAPASMPEALRTPGPASTKRSDRWSDADPPS